MINRFVLSRAVFDIKTVLALKGIVRDRTVLRFKCV